jgi:hypothetical protein
MSTNLKYFQLLQQIEKNPLRSKVAAAVDIVADFEKDAEAVGLDRRLSPEGKRDKAQGNLRKALRDLRDTRKTALDEHHSKTESMRAAATKLPTIDKTDLVAALNRRELRDASRAMTSGQRSMYLTGERRSVAFIDSLLEFPDDPWIAGINIHDPGEREIFEMVKQERLRDFHGPLIDTIAERDAVESEAQMIIDVARNDLKMHSGLEDRAFAEFAKPIESKAGACWLKKSTDLDGNEKIIVLDLAPLPGAPTSRWATPDEIRDGKFYENLAAYQADRSAA